MCIIITSQFGKTYEPGSTFKIITFSSALNENLFDMDKDTYFDKGYEIVNGARIKSWKKGGHGLQTFREVLQNSSNRGFCGNWSSSW